MPPMVERALYVPYRGTSNPIPAGEIPTCSWVLTCRWPARAAADERANSVGVVPSSTGRNDVAGQLDGGDPGPVRCVLQSFPCRWQVYPEVHCDDAGRQVHQVLLLDALRGPFGFASGGEGQIGVGHRSRGP